MKIDNLSHSNQTFENMYISHPQMQAIILFKNLDFFPTKSQNDAWQPPKPLKLNIFEFIYRGCQLLTRKCHRTKFFRTVGRPTIMLIVDPVSTVNFTLFPLILSLVVYALLYINFSSFTYILKALDIYILRAFFKSF